MVSCGFSVSCSMARRHFFTHHRRFVPRSLRRIVRVSFPSLPSPPMTAPYPDAKVQSCCTSTTLFPHIFQKDQRGRVTLRNAPHFGLHASHLQAAIFSEGASPPSTGFFTKPTPNVAYSLRSSFKRVTSRTSFYTHVQQGVSMDITEHLAFFVCRTSSFRENLDMADSSDVRMCLHLPR